MCPDCHHESTLNRGDRDFKMVRDILRNDVAVHHSIKRKVDHNNDANKKGLA